MRKVTLRVTREFTFDLELDDDAPAVTTPDEFYALYGPESVGDDSVLVDEVLHDPAA